MKNKTDFSNALRATSAKQKTVIEDRFSRADSVLLNPTKSPVTSCIRDTFSMPVGEHAIIEKLRLIAAKEDVLINKSEIVRCALLLLGEMESDELIKRFENMKRDKPLRK